MLSHVLADLSGGPPEDLLEQNLSKTLHFLPGSHTQEPYESDYGAPMQQISTMEPNVLTPSQFNSAPHAQPHIQPHMQHAHMMPQQREAEDSPAPVNNPSNVNLAALGIDPRVLAGLDSSLLSSLNLFTNSAPS